METAMIRLPFLAALLALTALAGCNTTAGFGRDVEETGEFITEGAQDVAN